MTKKSAAKKAQKMIDLHQKALRGNTAAMLKASELRRLWEPEQTREPLNDKEVE